MRRLDMLKIKIKERRDFMIEFYLIDKFINPYFNIVFHWKYTWELKIDRYEAQNFKVD